MGLQLGLFMNQRMKQELRMTPQLQQAIRLLLLSRVELIEELRQELSSNPLLDEAEPGDERSDERSDERHEQPDEGLGERGDQEGMESNLEGDSSELARDEIDWERYIDEMPGGADEMPYQDRDELPGIDVTYSRGESLHEHLTWQLEVSQLRPEVVAVARHLISYINDHGYLVAPPLDEIAESLALSLELVQESLQELQALDPLGVAARDLRECLLLQAEAYELSPLVKEMIDLHLNDLERRRYPQIARARAVSLDEVYEAMQRIQALDPYPGNAFSSDEPQYVIPDLYVVREAGDYRVQTNDEGLPKLKINNYYKRMIRQSSDQEAKQYVTERLNAAYALIKSVEQRKQTIVRVMESIIKHQRDFFEHGPEHLKPLVLKTIADDLELHESTISRVTTNKYVQTPRGLYDLKFFFNSMIQGAGSQDDLASEAVKVKIKKLIGDEDPKRPLSDQKITDKLGEDGLQIARRTVAKYREALGILPSSQRKRHF